MPLHPIVPPRVRRLVPLGAAAVGLALSGCGAALPEPSLHDMAQVQTAIEQTLSASQHRHGTAYCPTDVPAIKGQVFSCVVELSGAAPEIFQVTVQNAQGAVDYIRTQ